jgi:glycosyl hydrolase family 26
VRRYLVIAAVGLVLAPSGAARTAGHPLMLGVLGNASRFAVQTGQHAGVDHAIFGWGHGYTYGGTFAGQFARHGPVPMIGITTSRGWPHRYEAITSRGISIGAGDGYLSALNRAIADWGRLIFIRPFPEMNGHWNAYCAYTASGRPKDAAHSTRMFRRAFARVYLLLHGGTADQLNARLRALGMPKVSHDFQVNPYPTLRVVWNPQGYGSPDLPGNSAQAYYPGDRYVDVVGNDLYDQGGKAEWDANERLFKAHPHKPYAIPEWGLWGIDDPAFVRHMAGWARAHYRVQLLAWFESRPGSVFDLATKPRSRVAYRRYITPLG